MTAVTAFENLITAVPGVRVGHAQDAGAASGVTAILIAQPNVASCVVRGGAPGGRDTGLLEPDMTVPGVDAIVLSGGSAYGLDAAGGVMGWLREAGIGLAVGPALVPIVAQAICFDLLNGGNKAWGRQPPYWDLGWQAASAASTAPFALGTAGGGYGATTATLKGGIGSASALTSAGIRVGAIVVVNAIGTATVGAGPHFWAAPVEAGAEFGGLGLPATFAPADLALRTKGGGPPSTTIGLVVTATMAGLGIRAFVALGVIAGLLEFVPVFGPIVGAIPAIALGFVDSPQKALWVTIAFVVIQQLEGNVLISCD